MHRFKKILCFAGGLDPQPGLDRAAELAARNGAARTRSGGALDG